MVSVNDLEEVQYLYHFQNSNHSQLLNDATLQNYLEPAKIEIRTQVDDDGIWVIMMSCQISNIFDKYIAVTLCRCL